MSLLRIISVFLSNMDFKEEIEKIKNSCIFVSSYWAGFNGKIKISIFNLFHVVFPLQDVWIVSVSSLLEQRYITI